MFRLDIEIQKWWLLYLVTSTVFILPDPVVSKRSPVYIKKRQSSSYNETTSAEPTEGGSPRGLPGGDGGGGGGGGEVIRDHEPINEEGNDGHRVMEGIDLDPMGAEPMPSASSYEYHRLPPPPSYSHELQLHSHSIEDINPYRNYDHPPHPHPSYPPHHHHSDHENDFMQGEESYMTMSSRKYEVEQDFMEGEDSLLRGRGGPPPSRGPPGRPRGGKRGRRGRGRRPHGRKPPPSHGPKHHPKFISSNRPIVLKPSKLPGQKLRGQKPVLLKPSKLQEQSPTFVPKIRDSLRAHHSFSVEPPSPRYHPTLAAPPSTQFAPTRKPKGLPTILKEKRKPHRSHSPIAIITDDMIIPTGPGTGSSSNSIEVLSLLTGPGSGLSSTGSGGMSTGSGGMLTGSGQQPEPPMIRDPHRPSPIFIDGHRPFPKTPKTVQLAYYYDSDDGRDLRNLVQNHHLRRRRECDGLQNFLYDMELISFGISLITTIIGFYCEVIPFFNNGVRISYSSIFGKGEDFPHSYWPTRDTKIDADFDKKRTFSIGTDEDNVREIMSVGKEFLGLFSLAIGVAGLFPSLVEKFFYSLDWWFGKRGLWKQYLYTYKCEIHPYPSPGWRR